MPDAAPPPSSIVVAPDGPYVVSGLPVTEQKLTLDDDGNTWNYETLATLDAHVGFHAHEKIEAGAQ